MMIMEIIFYLVCIWAFYRFNVSLHESTMYQYDIENEHTDE